MASSAGPQLPAGEETNNNRPIGAISSDTLGALYLFARYQTLCVSSHSAVDHCWPRRRSKSAASSR